MEIGALEIVLIILVIIAVLVKVRLSRALRPVAGQDETPTSSTSVDASSKSSGRAEKLLHRTGIILIVGGVAALLMGAGLFRMVFQSYVWAFILIAIGFVLVFFSRRKR